MVEVSWGGGGARSSEMVRNWVCASSEEEEEGLENDGSICNGLGSMAERRHC